MTLIEIAFVVVVAGMVLLFGGMLWIESRRAEVRRTAETAVPSDPPTADSSQETPCGPRHPD
jgi:hypothetical protein